MDQNRYRITTLVRRLFRCAVGGIITNHPGIFSQIANSVCDGGDKSKDKQIELNAQEAD